MKLPKKLLLVLASSFLLVGCNEPNKGEQCPTCEECRQTVPGTDDGITDDELLEIVRNRIVEDFDALKAKTKDTEILSYLDELKTSALKDTEDMFYIYDEESAIEGADIIVGAYSENLKDKLVATLSNRLLTLIASTRDPEAHAFFNEIRDRYIQPMLDELTGMEEMLDNYVHANNDIDEFIGRTPGGREEDFIYRYKEALSEYGYWLLSEYNDYLEEKVITDHIDEQNEKFDEVDDEETAEALLEELKAEMYAFALNNYKKNLCGALQAFSDEVNENFTNEKIKADFALWVEGDKESVCSHSSFEKALTAYDGAVDVLTNELETATRRFCMDKFEHIYSDYDTRITDEEAWKTFYKEGCKVEAELLHLNPYVIYLEKEMLEIINGFETFCKTLVTE